MNRRWFQIHLSTAIILMLVAGGLLWLNLPRERIVDDEDQLELQNVLKDEAQRRGIKGVVNRFRLYSAGWPSPYSLYADNGQVRVLDSRTAYWKLLVDFAIGATILCGTAICCEGFTRSREAQKT